MTKHMKLSDVEAHKIYPFRQTTTFENAFPNVGDIRVEVRIQGEEFDPAPGHPERLNIYKNGNIPTIINCQNPRCYSGGLDLHHLLRWVIAEKRTEFAEVTPCRGYEGSPKGRRNDGPCDTSFGVIMTIQYKEAERQDGIITNHVVIPGEGIEERADQLLHDPPNADVKTMNDTQKKLL